MNHIPGLSFLQVANASLTLKLLADSDQRSFRALRQEVDVLESRLHECEREKEQEETSIHPDPPLSPGEVSDEIFPRYHLPKDRVGHAGLPVIY